jgi:hypothetical protein
VQVLPSQPMVGPGRVRWGSCLAFSAVLLVTAAFVLNNLAPYLGLHHAAAMIMFSRLTGPADNHLLVVKRPLTEAYTYVSDLRIDARGLQTPAAREFQAFADITSTRGWLVNLNFVRYHASRICQSAPNAGVRLALTTEAGGRIDVRNVCEEPSLLWYTAPSGYPECEPECEVLLKRWAMGRMPIR